MNKKLHPYHIVDVSPYPLFVGVSALQVTLGLVYWLHNGSSIILKLGTTLLIICILFWVRDVIREAVYLGCHTKEVERGLSLGFILFIVSEVCLFVSLFWAFFHSSLSPAIDIGMTWPPKGIDPIDPFAIPLLNTVILISSGVTITWAHYKLLSRDKLNTIIALGLTIALGVFFTGLQLYEYKESTFTIADSVYGSCFYLATGFHGAHVLLGTIFLTVCYWRILQDQFNHLHHLWFETSSWYWHFVDVVWLFLYVCIYWWGS